MRALVVTNMFPTPARPALGSFVRDQVQALRRIDGIEVTVFAFDPGGTAAYLKAANDLRTTHRGDRFDVVHAHFGLTAWPAFAASGRKHAVTLHGTDLTHPRSRKITLGALPFEDLVATVSAPLANQLPRWAARKRQAILPAGVATDRFRPIPRAQARTALGLDPDGPYLLFPADPSRPEKRYDRAAGLAA
jgi:glycosyltransferase involved in cell wall biosynthesis